MKRKYATENFRFCWSRYQDLDWLDKGYILNLKCTRWRIFVPGAPFPDLAYVTYPKRQKREMEKNVSLGYVEVVNDTYQITDKGRTYLEDCNKSITSV